MKIELTEAQRELLTELLEAAHRVRTHELHRTDSLSYKQLLRDKITTIENLRDQIEVAHPVG
ncbi:MAG: hypothetical protein IT348_16890 [Candidatus Eisenbacteria bacterium]|nr:hypothetical protein [Candidatus Eisenbacteria bacterium]